MQLNKSYPALLFTASLVAFTLTACGETTPEKPTDAAPAASTAAPASKATGNKAEYEAALAAAKTAQKQASTAGGEWRDIDKQLKEADTAAKAEDYAKATKIAQKAKDQAEMGIAQATAEKSAGHPSVLKGVKIK